MERKTIIYLISTHQMSQMGHIIYPLRSIGTIGR